MFDNHRIKTRTHIEYRPMLDRSKICTVVWVLLTISGWITAVVFMVLWESLHEVKVLPDPRSTDSGMPRFSHAAVAADAAVCSEMGRDVIRDQGGNAVDAAITSLLCDGIMNPHSMGIGGGFFMTIYNRSTEQATAIDARETAPKAIDIEMYKKYPQNQTRGWLSIAVPGEVKGYWLAHKKYGRIPWAQLFQPVIRMAREGFYVHKPLAIALNWLSTAITSEPTFGVYINPKTDTVYQLGDRVRLPVYAKFLEDLSLATNPDQFFYNSSFTKKLVAELNEEGSILSEQDFKQYRVRVYPAQKTKLSSIGLTAYTLNAPSSGPVLSFFLRLIEGLNLPQDSFKRDVDSATHAYHYYLEALKFAYAHWAQIGDVHFQTKVNLILSNLTSPDYLKLILANITASSHPASYYLKGVYQPEKFGTAHISVLDNEGNAVAVTSSTNYYFGALRMSSSTGIIWNNHMADFNSFASPAAADTNDQNHMAPGKRPRSAMTPTILVDSETKNVRLVTGASGGSRILMATANVVMRVLFFNETLKEATDALRIWNLLSPDETRYERGFPGVILKDLKKHGHLVKETEVQRDNVQSISVANGQIYAFCDSRKESFPAGF